MNNNLNAPVYLRPLDTLRAISVFFVFAEHMIFGVFKRFSPGGFGVDFFFVLSGFLITRILYNQKIAASKKSIKIRIILKQFYVRRVLRIFPLYYGTILLLYIINFHEIRNLIEYYIFYLVNFITPIEGVKALSFPAPHFWSLSVEEQFYLFWPLLVLLNSEKTLKWIIVIFFFTTPFLQSWPWGAKYLSLSPLGQFPSLGIGAYLSIMVKNDDIRLKSCFIAFSIFLVIYILSLTILYNFNFAYFIRSYSQGLLCASIILISIYTENSPIWKNKFLIYSGKISYGLYVYHYIIREIIIDTFEKYGKHFHLVAGRLQLPIFLVTTYLIAIISYEFYEKRILSLKVNFII